MTTRIALLTLLCVSCQGALVNPFVPRSNLYKVVVHIHCNVPPDDGDLSPATIGSAYASDGIPAYSITPHDSTVEDPGTPGITYFKGEECSCHQSDHVSHAIALFITSTVVSNTAQGVINNVKSQNGFIVLAHPGLAPPLNWTTNEMMAATNWDAIEISNGGAQWDLWWDHALTNGRKVWGIVGPDAHTDTPTNRFIYVNANSVSDIPAEIKSGNFYPSYKDTLSITTTSTTVYAASAVSGTFRWTVDGLPVQTNTSATTSSLTLYPTNIYARVRFVGADYVWSQPVFWTNSSNWFVTPNGAGSKDGTSLSNAWKSLTNVVWGTSGVASNHTLYVCGTHLMTNSDPSVWGFSSGEITPVSGVTIRGDYPGNSGAIFCGSIWQVTGEGNWNGPDANGVYNNKDIEYGATHYELSLQVDGTNITRLGYETNTTWVGKLGTSSFKGNTNFVKTLDGSIPNGNLAVNNYGWYFNIAGLSGINFQGLRIIGPMFQNSGSASASNIVFRNCVMSDECLPMISVGNHNWLFDGCEISFATEGGVYAYNNADPGDGAAGLVVTNCFIHDIDANRYIGGDGHGIGVREFGVDYRLVNNVIVGTGSAIELFGGSQTNITVADNVISNTHVCFTDGGGISLTGDGGKSGIYIYRNLVLNAGTNSTETYQGYGISTGNSNYVWIWNNTVSNANVGIVATVAGMPVAADIRNNIVLNPRTSYLYLHTTTDPAKSNVLTVVDYNLYHSNAVLSTPIFCDFAITAMDAHSIYSDPMLNGTYHLSIGSPAINAGTNVGLPFYGTAPDIGAYEWQSPSVLRSSTLRAGTLRGK